MSATIGNLKEISVFLNAELYVQNFRPVEVKEYVTCDRHIWLVDNKLEEIFTDKKVLNYPVRNCKIFKISYLRNKK